MNFLVFILILIIEAIVFLFFLYRNRKNVYVKNKSKVVDSIKRIRSELDTLEHRIELNEQEKNK